MRRLLVVPVLLLAACAGDAAVQGRPVVQTAADCVTVGGGELQAGLKLGFGATSAEVLAVQSKDGEPAAHVGFTLAPTDGLRYIVSAAGEMYCDEAADFTTKNGAVIDSVDFCVQMPACP